MNAQLHLIGTSLFSKDAVAIEITPDSKIDFSKVCRTCLRETKDNNLENEALYMIGCNGQLAQLFEIFEIATGLKIRTDDNLPGHICNSCLQSLKNSFSFYCQSQRANDILKSVLISVKNDEPSRDIQEVENSEVQPDFTLDDIPEELPEESRFPEEEVMLNFHEYSVDDEIAEILHEVDAENEDINYF